MAEVPAELMIRLIAKDEASKVVSKFKSELTGISEATKKTNASINGFTKTMKNMFGVVAASVVFSKLKNEVMASLDAVGQFEQAMTGLSSVAAAFGHDAKEAQQAAQSLSEDGLMSVRDSADGLKNLLATGFSMDESIKLMNAFKDSAAFNRQGTLEFGQAIVGATQGLKNQNSIMVDNAGITKNLSNILVEAGYSQQDLAKATTDTEVRTALYNGILKEAAAFTGDAEKATETYEGKMSQLNTAIFYLRKEIGEQLLPTVELLIDGLTDLLGSSEDALNGSNGLARGMYAVANVFMGSIYAMKSLGSALAMVALALYGGAMNVKSFVSDVAGNFRRLGYIIAQWAAGFQDIVTGNFAGAIDRLKSLLTGSFAATISSYQTGFTAVTSAAFEGSQNWAKAMEYFSEAWNQTNFKAIELSFDNTREAVDRTGNAAEDAGEKTKESAEDAEKAQREHMKLVEKFAESFSILRDKAIDAWDALKDRMAEIREPADKVRGKIKEIRQEMRELRTSTKDDIKEIRREFKANLPAALDEIKDDYQESADDLYESFHDSFVDVGESFESDVADVIVEAEESIAEAQAEYAEQSLKYQEQVTDKRAELEKELTDLMEDQADERAELSDLLALNLTNRQKEAIRDQLSELDAQHAKELSETQAVAAEEIADLEEQRDAELAVIQAQIDEENALLDEHAQDYIDFAEAITEARRKTNLDAIEDLKESIVEERAALEEKYAEDLAELKEAKQEKIAALYEERDEAIQAAKDERDARLKVLKQEIQDYEDKLDERIEKEKKKMEKAQNNFKEKLKGIVDDADGLIGQLLAQFTEIPVEAASAFDKLENKLSAIFDKKGFKKLANLLSEITGKVSSTASTDTEVQAFAKGGIVQGHSGTDSVAALLTPGETVLPPGVNPVTVEVNFNNVNVRNDNDMATLEKVITDTINRNLRFAKLGV